MSIQAHPNFHAVKFLCGQKLDPVVAFIGGEKSVASQLFTDPPMHKECAKYAARTCPYLSSDNRQFSKLKPQETHAVRDLVDPTPPKHMAIYYTKNYKYGRVKGHDGTYIQADPATSVDWSVLPGGPPPIEVVEHPVTSFEDLMAELKEGHGFMYLTKDPTTYEFKVRKITTDDLKERNDLSWFNVVCPLIRLDMWEKYSQHLEYTYFKPDTPINDQFNLIFFKWEGIDVGIISVPIQRRKWCEQAADCKLRLADGTAKILGGGLINKVPASQLMPSIELGIMMAGTEGAAFPLVSDHTRGLEPQYDTPGPRVVIMAQKSQL